MTRMTQVKLIATAVAVLLLTIIVLQNREPVETDILLMTVEMPRIVLLLVTLATGFIAGLVTAGVLWPGPKKP
ncbi:MAG: LapA family protein [Phycisphaeraceae bacterium]|nr:LapA family protein [Phycisphaeraceae bacterium]